MSGRWLSFGLQEAILDIVILRLGRRLLSGADVLVERLCLAGCVHQRCWRRRLLELLGVNLDVAEQGS